jgi:hypothetical protein
MHASVCCPWHIYAASLLTLVHAWCIWPMHVVACCMLQLDSPLRPLADTRCATVSSTACCHRRAWLLSLWTSLPHCYPRSTGRPIERVSSTGCTRLGTTVLVESLRVCSPSTTRLTLAPWLSRIQLHDWPHLKQRWCVQHPLFCLSFISCYHILATLNTTVVRTTHFSCMSFGLFSHSFFSFCNISDASQHVNEAITLSIQSIL